MVTRENIESVSGLVAMQRGMVFDHVSDPTADTYVEQFDFSATGQVDLELLRQAFEATSQHYGALRTIFSFRNTDDPYQLVLRTLPPQVDLVDLRGAADIAAAVRDFKEEDRRRGFDLTEGPLIRCAALATGPREWHLIVTFHHVILDGWSIGLVFMTLFGHYDQLAGGAALTQGREDRPYADYVSWFETQDENKARDHWSRALDGFEVPTTVPRDLFGKGFTPATHSFTFGSELSGRLREYCARNEVTLSAAFQTAWGVVLQRFNYADDVVFGSVVSGRGVALDGIETMVGLFANTQPLRVACRGGEDFATLSRRVQVEHHRASPYAWFPLYEVQRLSPLRSRLVDHVVAFENYPLSEQLQAFDDGDVGTLRLTGVDVFERTPYGFHIVVNPGSQLKVTFSYNAESQSPELVAALGETLVRTVDEAVTAPDRPVRELRAWAPPAPGPLGKSAPDELQSKSSLVAAFKSVVDTNGGRTALRRHDRSLTYAELDSWSDAVAERLHASGVRAGARVGILVDRSFELVVAMLAVLKTGASYVPLDLRDSTLRRTQVLDDAGVTAVCTVDASAEVPCVISLSRPDRAGEAFPWHDSDPDSDAYVMYTSGSTGKPKGCYIGHRNILRLVFEQDYLGFGPDRVFLQTSSPAFDACTLEVWGTILHGATLVLPDEQDILDPERLRRLLATSGADTMWLTSPLFNRLCDHDETIFGGLNDLLVGGSSLSVPHLRKLRAACPDVRITNGYGPTENTTFSLTHLVDDADLRCGRIPIGRPLVHSTATIVDRALRPVPPGAVGELCLGGAGLSRGYHGRPDLNAQVFFVAEDTGERLYRSGDLARAGRDGLVEYLGRIDDQVKVNGFRVEVGEVESHLRAVDGVRDAAVFVDDKEGTKRLNGRYVPAGAVTDDAVRAHLARRLPAYMVPTSIAAVAEIPLTRNGKVDRRKLARMAVASPSSPPPAATVMDGMYGVVSAVVAEVSGRDRVDPTAGFFDLGLNSLDLMTVSNRLRKSLDRDVPVTLLFAHPSVAALAAHLGTEGGRTGPATEPVAAEEEVNSSILAQFSEASEGIFG